MVESYFWLRYAYVQKRNIFYLLGVFRTIQSREKGGFHRPPHIFEFVWVWSWVDISKISGAYTITWHACPQKIIMSPKIYFHRVTGEHSIKAHHDGTDCLPGSDTPLRSSVDMVCTNVLKVF